ncbi:hypothetical protein [Fructobacillus parabroussonetiae]|uniref:Uncharacterized protein n=1 Tax=Fructobacillus parabroussonetiae TaxID=2713174 RepID=A0ABS5QXA9_9LACO|nr:hypothetical protein [Fructobacillus parabroussonetiae]MBS9337840.1 hypothetical protein [Fructobacillus parabroussonetiae]
MSAIYLRALIACFLIIGAAFTILFYPAVCQTVPGFLTLLLVLLGAFLLIFSLFSSRQHDDSL